jgi:hypothetical protein
MASSFESKAKKLCQSITKKKKRYDMALSPHLDAAAPSCTCEQKAINISTTYCRVIYCIARADGRYDLFTNIHAQYFAADKKCMIARSLLLYIQSL